MTEQIGVFLGFIAILSYAILIVCWLWVVVLASRNAIWKAAICFFIPIAAFAYGFRHYGESDRTLSTKLAMQIWLLAVGVGALTLFASLALQNK